ncbi:DMT family transporter [Hankyongella ginsenosidimutans]|uniref:DMT family transporter n=1 Tax=Hankyongella ginsenosidimutans TaxID=1763828 RepID=A0A4D7CB44_9SPHN|nr:DMT family transporter [Hankyongella ginsenosidimutans]QCI78926.1 DMT family transporter [Hankyongella ginsenosidimutans]
MKNHHFALMLLITLCWGFNVVPLKLALNELSPIAATALRFMLVLLLCAPFMRWHRGRMRLVTASAVLGGAMMFGLMNLAYSLSSNVSALAIAGQLGVPFSLIMAVLFLGERIRWRRTAGILLAFSGVAILTFDPAIAREWLPLALISASAMVWAVYTLLQRRFSGISALSLQGWLAAVSIPIMTVLSLVLEPGGFAPIVQKPWPVLGYLFYSALLSSVIGHAGFAWLLQRYPVSTLTPLTLLTPVFSVLFATLLLGNPFTLELLLGGLVTIAGIGVITVRTAQRAPSLPPITTVDPS